MSAGLCKAAAPRWWRSAGIALGVHLLAVLLVLAWPPRRPAPVPPQPPHALMVELAPLPSAPSAPPTALPPGPVQQEQEARPQLASRAPPVSPLTLAPIPRAEVTLPPPSPEDAGTAPASTARAAVLQSSAPPSVQAPSSTQYRAPESSSGASQAALANWQAQVLAHLERYKRYPRAARRRQVEGTSWVDYAVDRSGGVQWARLARGSGHAVLDEEAVAAVLRATPLPSPPAEVAGDPVQVSTPVQFLIR